MQSLSYIKPQNQQVLYLLFDKHFQESFQRNYIISTLQCNIGQSSPENMKNVIFKWNQILTKLNKSTLCCYHQCLQPFIADNVDDRCIKYIIIIHR